MYISSIFLTSALLAKAISLDWTVSWVENANPDGLHSRRVIGVNNQWPIPPIKAVVGDVLRISLTNLLNSPTSLHFHGLDQRNTTYYDGTLGITECGIKENSTLVYSVNLDRSGSYWVHSHHFGQYPDGFRTPLIIDDPKDAEIYEYDEDLMMGLSDWYHGYYDDLYEWFSKPGGNPAGLEPIPNSVILNDIPNSVLKFEKGKTYRLRLVCMSTFAAIQVWIDGHEMTVIEADSVLTKPFKTNIVTLTAAQRYSVLVTAKNDSDFNYQLHYALDTNMFANESPPTPFNPESVALIEYGPGLPTFNATNKPDPSAFDDISLEPFHELPSIPIDDTFRYDAMFALFSDNVNHGAFNYTVFETPIVPTLFTALTTGANASYAETYGPDTHTSVLGLDKGIQIVIVNKDGEGGHPFHLHGHTFQIVSRGQLAVLDDDHLPVKYGFDYGVLDKLDGLSNPVRRDTVQVASNGYAVIRFKADNPGIWLFHCHIQWHVQAGLVTQFVEAPDEIQKYTTIPDDISRQCQSQGVRMSGNAAGYFDRSTFTGIPKSPFIVGA